MFNFVYIVYNTYMRLLHKDIIQILPRIYLLHEHRTCCALRGRVWGRQDKNIRYVFRYSWETLIQHHNKILKEMRLRGYTANPKWSDFLYRGERTPPLTRDTVLETRRELCYREHDDNYLVKCAEQIKKGIDNNVKSVTPFERVRFTEWYCEIIK